MDRTASTSKHLCSAKILVCDHHDIIDIARCDCSEHGSCSTVNGSCLCEAGWEGPTCNSSMATTVASASNASDYSDSANNTDSGALTPPTSKASTPPGNEHVTASIPPGSEDVTVSSSTEEKAPSIASLRTLSVAVVIGTGIVSVIAHLLICWYCHRRYHGSHLSMGHPRTRPPPTRRKRRKLRKKTAFMQIPLQSSSDCSI